MVGGGLFGPVFALLALELASLAAVKGGCRVLGCRGDIGGRFEVCRCGGGIGVLALSRAPTLALTPALSQDGRGGRA